MIHKKYIPPLKIMAEASLNDRIDWEDPDYEIIAWNILSLLGEKEENHLDQTDKLKIFVGGTDDTSQTLYETLSLNLLIGVKAVNQEVGFALSNFLRPIIDKREEPLASVGERFYEDHEALDIPLPKTYQEAITFLGNQDDFMEVYPSGTRPRRTLSGNYTITKDPIEMDLWDFNRIRLVFEQDDTKYKYVKNLYGVNEDLVRHVKRHPNY